MFEAPVSATKITLYLADKDQHGNQVQDIDLWARKASKLLAKLFGGATRMRGHGMWFNEKLGTYIEETTHLVYCYFDPADMTKHASTLDDFISGYLRAANQQTVAVEIGDKMHFVGYMPKYSSLNGQTLVNGATHA